MRKSVSEEVRKQESKEIESKEIESTNDEKLKTAQRFINKSAAESPTETTALSAFFCHTDIIYH